MLTLHKVAVFYMARACVVAVALLTLTPLAGAHAIPKSLGPFAVGACVLFRSATRGEPDAANALMRSAATLRLLTTKRARGYADAVAAAAAAAVSSPAVQSVRGAATAAASATATAASPAVQCVRGAVVHTADTAGHLADATAYALSEPAAALRDAADAMASVSSSRIAAYSTAAAATASYAAKALTAATATAKVSFGAAAVVARAHLMTASAVVSDLALSLTPADVAATTLLAVTSITMRRAARLRAAREELLERLQTAEGELNTTRCEIARASTTCQLHSAPRRPTSPSLADHLPPPSLTPQDPLVHARRPVLTRLQSQIKGASIHAATKQSEVVAAHSRLADLEAELAGLHSSKLAAASTSHDAQLQAATSTAKRKRARLAGALARRRKEAKEATAAAAALHAELTAKASTHAQIVNDAEKARADAADAQQAVDSAMARVAAKSEEVVTLQGHVHSERKRAEAAEARRAELEDEIAQRLNRLDDKRFGAQASLASMQLELASSREQIQTLRAAQKKATVGAARAASDAAAELGGLQQRMAAAEAAHAQEVARAEILWAQREAEFRADVQAAQAKRQQEVSNLMLQKAEADASIAELDARVHAAAASERSMEGGLQQARSDAKAARRATEQHAARAASLEEALGEARAEVARYKHDLTHHHADHSEELLKADLAARRANELLEAERMSKRTISADAAEHVSRTQFFEQLAADANAALALAREDAAAAAAAASEQQRELEGALQAANDSGANLAAELARARARADKAEAAALAHAAEVSQLHHARERDARRAARSHAAATLGVDAVPTSTRKQHLDEVLFGKVPTGVDFTPTRPTPTTRPKTAPAAQSKPHASRVLPLTPVAPKPPAAQQSREPTPPPAAKPRRSPSLTHAQALKSEAIRAIREPTEAPPPSRVQQTTRRVKAARRALTMVVGKLPQHVSPARLLSEFGTALTAEAHYDAKTNQRMAVVLTFPPGKPPARRSSSSLGCVLQPVVNPPEGAASSTKVVWYREDGHVRQRTHAAAEVGTMRP